LEGPIPVQKNKEIKKRVISSAVIISVSAWVIVASPPAVYFCVASFFILAALNEFVTMARHKGISLNRPLILSLGLLTPWLVQGPGGIFYVAILILLLFLVSSARNDLPDAFSRAAYGFLGIVWIGWLFSYVVNLRYVESGVSWVIYAIAVTKLGDMAAYFVGKKWGRTQFLPHISPKKTREGAAGQFAGSILFSCLSAFYLDAPLAHLLILGAVIGVAAQAGDMVESMVKRNLEYKDSGAVPGLGGFMDILDSLLFTVPIVYFYVTQL
jgi:phosphatidate cytidylyltransferase